MTAHAPNPQDSVQIIARFVRGNCDLPEQVGAGLIEELASEGWIITRAQVFNDMLALLKELWTDPNIVSHSQRPPEDWLLRTHAAIAKAEGRVIAANKP